MITFNSFIIVHVLFRACAWAFKDLTVTYISVLKNFPDCFDFLLDPHNLSKLYLKLVFDQYSIHFIWKEITCLGEIPVDSPISSGVDTIFHEILTFVIHERNILCRAAFTSF